MNNSLLSATTMRQQAIHALCKGRSMSLLSRRIGYKFNKVYRWHSGQSRMTWEEFMEFAKVCGAPIKEAYAELKSGRKGEWNIPKLIGSLLQGLTDAEVALQLGIKSSIVKKWRQNCDLISVDHTLLLLSTYHPSFINFIEVLMQKKIPEFARNSHQSAEKVRRKFATSSKKSELATCGVVLEINDYDLKKKIDVDNFRTFAKFIESHAARPKNSFYSTVLFECEESHFEEISNILDEAKTKIRNLVVQKAGTGRKTLLALGLVDFTEDKSGVMDNPL